jgi:hypothetical protein
MIRLTVAVLVCMMMVGVAATSAATAPAGEVKPAAPPSAVEKALDSSIAIDFEKTSLDNVLKYIGEVPKGLKLEIDPAIAADGIDLSTRLIDAKIRSTTVRELLGLVLGTDLGLKVEADRVVVTTAKKAVELKDATYAVKDILDRIEACDTAAGKGFSTPETRRRARDLLADAIKALTGTANPYIAMWDDKEGPATALKFDGDTLSVRQTAANHGQVAELLDLIREAFAAQPLPAAGLPTAPKTPVISPKPSKEVAEVNRGLQEKIDIDFERTGLDNVLKYIGDLRRVDIVVSPDLAADGLDLSTRLIDMKVKGLTIAQILDLILIPHLDYCVRPGYVLVSTYKRLVMTLPVAAFPVLDLAPSRDNGYATLCKVLWGKFEENHGVGMWVGDEPETAIIVPLGGVLLVAQAPRDRDNLSQTLMAIREEQQAAAEEVKAQQKGEAPGPLTALPDRRTTPPALLATRKLLEKPLKANFEATSLGAILRYMGDTHPNLKILLSLDVDMKNIDVDEIMKTIVGLNIVISPDVAWASIDIEKMLVTYRDTKPVGEVLKAVLGNELDYVVKPGYVLIVPQKMASQRLVVDAYAIAERLTGPAAKQATAPEKFPLPPTLTGEFNWDALVALIRKNVDAAKDPRVAKWIEQDDTASVQAVGGVLVVRQTEEGHRRVVALLNQLIRDRFRPAPKDPLGPL